MGPRGIGRSEPALLREAAQGDEGGMVAQSFADGDHPVASSDPVPDANLSRGFGSTARRLPLLSRPMLLGMWLPLGAITLLHYGLGGGHSWIHDVLRRAYYLPIVVGAVLAGLRGGLVASGIACVLYLPHAFILERLADPGAGLEKALEMVLYLGVGGVAGALADQEARRHAELRAALQEQQRLTRELVRAGRLSALGEMVAGIAHEIKNPLHALAGTAEVVDHLIPAEAEERRLWELHVSEIERLGRTAERFLSFARPREPVLENVDLRQVASRLHDLVAADARQRGVSLSLDRPREAVSVRGDPDQLTQVGMNIVLNALHAVGSSGQVKIRVGRRADAGRQVALLQVENNGPPIPEEDLERIFDPFASGHAEGSGLGLSVASRIASAHGGYITAENGGLGVRFTFVLPAEGGQR